MKSIIPEPFRSSPLFWFILACLCIAGYTAEIISLYPNTSSLIIMGAGGIANLLLTTINLDKKFRK